MFDALDVARRLIGVGYEPDNPDESVLICPLRLQKLLYYCQGWSLGLLGRPLFRQPLEAWSYGPVVREVYHKFNTVREGIVPELAGDSTTEIPTRESTLIEMVWREYARYTPRQLIAMTHAEPAWREARGNLPPEAKSSTALSLATMTEYFRGLVQKKAKAGRRSGFPVLDPVEVWQAEQDDEHTGGTGVPAAEVFRKLLAEAGE